MITKVLFSRYVSEITLTYCYGSLKFLKIIIFSNNYVEYRRFELNLNAYLVE